MKSDPKVLPFDKCETVNGLLCFHFGGKCSKNIIDLEQRQTVDGVNDD